ASAAGVRRTARPPRSRPEPARSPPAKSAAAPPGPRSPGPPASFVHDGDDMRIDDWLAQRAQSCPERTALIAEGAEVTYAELEAEATWIARRLAAHGVRRGSTAALTMHPRREQVVMTHALMKVGAALLPLSPRL